MTAIPLKSIEGLMIEKIVKPLNGEKRNDEEVMKIDFYNQAITQQGEVKITLNREKLAKMIGPALWGETWNQLGEILQKNYYENHLKLSDAILNALPGLVEVVQ